MVSEPRETYQFFRLGFGIELKSQRNRTSWSVIIICFQKFLFFIFFKNYYLQRIVIHIRPDFSYQNKIICSNFIIQTFFWEYPYFHFHPRRHTHFLGQLSRRHTKIKFYYKIYFLVLKKYFNPFLWKNIKMNDFYLCLTLLEENSWCMLKIRKLISWLFVYRNPLLWHKNIIFSPNVIKIGMVLGIDYIKNIKLSEM